jgi:delta-aminolevulinic acid dehydratase/porphobilinogen synthase
MNSNRRAGADIIITYFAKDVARVLERGTLRDR